jgi:hypothetical protein
VRQRKQLEEKQSELQQKEDDLNEEISNLMEKFQVSRRNFEMATKEKSTARLKNKNTLTNEQNQVQSFKMINPVIVIRILIQLKLIYMVKKC